MAVQTGCSSQRWLLLELGNRPYALPVSNVREMLSMREQSIVSIAEAPEHAKGVIKLRDSVIPVLDLRRLLGMSAQEEEVADVLDTLEAREEDHVNWLEELEAAVHEDREFTLTTDPHECKFGKWYDQTRSCGVRRRRFTKGSASLEVMLDAFDAPHRSIHALASKVAETRASEGAEAATLLISRARENELKSLRGLFAKTAQTVKAIFESVLVVVEYEDLVLGLTVDAVDTVLDIEPEQVSPVSSSLQTAPGVVALASLKDIDDTVLMLDVGRLISHIGAEEVRHAAARRMKPGPAALAA